MEFKRRKVKGKRQETFKRWVSESGNYRVDWRSGYGIVGYYAMVDNGDGRWGHAGRIGHYRTRRAAVRACEFHFKKWRQYLSADRAKRAQLRRLVVGTKVRARRLFSEPPKWCRDDRRVQSLL